MAPKKALVKGSKTSAGANKAHLAKPIKAKAPAVKKIGPKKAAGSGGAKGAKGKGKGKKKGKKGKRRKKKKKTRRCPIKRRKKAIKRKCTDLFSPSPILNLYYTAHSVPDALKIQKMAPKAKKK